METRAFEKLGIESSLLGFGCMRFPTTETGEIDEARAMKMVHDAMDQGVTYIDTAYGYHDGKSEEFTGRILKTRDRSSFTIATKMPVWYVKTIDDAKRIFAEQCERLQVDYVDFYLIHALNKEHFDNMKALGVIEYCAQLKEEGKIKYLGFSFHDEYVVFEEILNYRDWDFCQIQLNYKDTKEQAGMKGYELAASKGIPLVIMEPVKGGALARYSEDINAMFDAIDPGKSVASFAFRWLAALPNVKVILSGMSTEEQVQDNLNTFQNYVPLTEDQINKINDIVEVIEARVKSGCTACRYCMPCPFGVDIPHNFALWNKKHMYDPLVAKADYERTEEKAKADKCVKCGKCEEVCPQKIQIRNDLEKVVADFV